MTEEPWNKHTPGDPMPCKCGDSVVEVKLRQGGGIDPARHLNWGKIKFAPSIEITAWRFVERKGEDVIAADPCDGPGETPHQYSPNPMLMGDCDICGHTAAAHRSDTVTTDTMRSALRQIAAMDASERHNGNRNDLIACAAVRVARAALKETEHE